MGGEPTEPFERWTAKRRAGLVLRIIKGETSVAEAARQHGLTVGEVEAWQEQFLRAAENGLRRRPKDEEALKEEQIKKLKQKIGDLVVENDVLREALKPYPLGREMSDA
jgi:transposase-like protein